MIVVVAVAIPAATALAALLLRGTPALRDGAILAAAALLFAAVVSLVPEVAAGARPGVFLVELFPGLALALRVEPLGLTFALIASFLWFVTTLYAIGYLRAHHDEHQSRFHFFFALSIAATMGAAFAANLLTLYAFYEALTLLTVPLVTHYGSAEARRAGRTYVGSLLGTSLTLLLLALGWTYALTGSLEFTGGGVFGRATAASPAVLGVLYVLFVLGTGKAALMPFHRWLPAAMVAPTPVSALLHAVAVVKLGVFTILKVTVYTFGIGTLAGIAPATFLQALAAATLLLSAIAAMREDNLKRRLAYSTISQLAYIVLAAVIAHRLGILAGGMHIAAHAFAKITLFFCAGALLTTLHIKNVSELRGVGRIMPITMTAWLVASFSVVGLPLTGGFWSKWTLALGAIDAGAGWLAAVVLFGSLLALGYLVPPAVRAFYAPAVGAAPPPRAGPEAPWQCLAALVVTATLSVALFFFADPVFAFLGSMDGLR